MARGKHLLITCACGCGRKKKVREADRSRGWGKYYDKSCKAKAQEMATGQYGRMLRSRVRAVFTEPEVGFDA